MVNPGSNRPPGQFGHKTSIVSFNCICCQPYLPLSYFSWWISLSNWKRIGRTSCCDFYSSGNMAPISSSGWKFFQDHFGGFLWRYRILDPPGSPDHNSNTRILYYRTHQRNDKRSLEDLLGTDLDSLEERLYICGDCGFWSLFIVLSQLVGRRSVWGHCSKPPKLHRTGYNSFLS